MVFKNQKCLDCGATGDSRLMPKYCHMEPVYIHPGNIVQYHPKGIFKSLNFHPYVLQVFWTKLCSQIFWGLNYTAMILKSKGKFLLISLKQASEITSFLYIDICLAHV